MIHLWKVVFVFHLDVGGVDKVYTYESPLRFDHIEECEDYGRLHGYLMRQAKVSPQWSIHCVDVLAKGKDI